MTWKHKTFTTAQRLHILRRHLVEKIPVLDLCHELGLEPELVNDWLAELFEPEVTGLSTQDIASQRRYEKRIAVLEGNLVKKDQALAQLRGRLERLQEAEIGRKQAEEASKDIERRYQYIFQSVPVSIWEEDYSRLRTAIDALRDQGVTDFTAYLEEHPDFVREAVQMIRVTDVNRETLKMFEARSKEELLGSPARVLPSGSLDSFRDELKAIADGKPIFEAEGITRTLKGTDKHVLVRIAIPPAPQNFGHMLLTLLDITRRKEAEDALRKSEERLRAIFEAARDVIYIKDRNLRYTHVNPALTMLMGDSRDLLGCTDEDLYGEEAARQLREVDLRVLAGQPVEHEHSRPINGMHRTFHDVRVPLRSSEGDIIGICGISRDITERRMIGQAHRGSVSEYPSAAMRSTLAKARHAAAADGVVLLTGESGSGKDHMARYIHAHSPRSEGPFFSINCAALTHELAESELFGHEAGAFTGARNRKRGLLELAEGGTLLLNEIGELPLSMQSKLLTFLDTKSFMRVGGEKTVTVNARLIAATHRDLKEEVKAGRFSGALYYRLDVFSIGIPPLRERLEDIPQLVEEITEKLIAETKITTSWRPTPDLIEALSKHNWPGNIRELRNVLERALILPDSDIMEISVPGTPGAATWICDVQFPPDGGLSAIRNQITRSLCVEALKRTGGNKKAAARLLGISRYSFYRHLKAYGTECKKVTHHDKKCDSATYPSEDNHL